MEETTLPKTETPHPTALAKPREIRVVQDTGPLAYIFDTARFEHMYRIAEAMASAPIIPDHLRGRWLNKNDFEEYSLNQIKGNCFRIVNQAVRWGIDPFAIVDETYVTGGKLAYQGKVIAALVNTRAPLKERLKYTYSGERGKDNLTIHVSGTFEGEANPSAITLSVAQAKTQNAMWIKDPEQKLVYSGVIRWARRYTPELILGVVTDDDIEREEAWRAESAKQIQVATQRAAKPNWVEAPTDSKTHDQPAAAEARISEAAAQEVVDQERKVQEASAAPSAKDTLFAEFIEEESRADFLKGLRKINYPGIPAKATQLSELPEELCEQILRDGVEELWAKSSDELFPP